LIRFSPESEGDSKKADRRDARYQNRRQSRDCLTYEYSHTHFRHEGGSHSESNWECSISSSKNTSGVQKFVADNFSDEHSSKSGEENEHDSLTGIRIGSELLKRLRHSRIAILEFTNEDIDGYGDW